MGGGQGSLEASCVYLAAETRPQKQVRVNAIVPGPDPHLASSAIAGILRHESTTLEVKASRSKRTVTQQEVGSTAAFLASPLASGHTPASDLRGRRLLHQRDVSALVTRARINGAISVSERMGITRSHPVDAGAVQVVERQPPPAGRPAAQSGSVRQPRLESTRLGRVRVWRREA